MSAGAGNGGYLVELGSVLRDMGLPEERIESTLADLATHLERTGAAALAAFGPVEEYAGRLVPEGGGDTESPVETWRWTADPYADETLLNRFGGEGWEVEGIDAHGRFLGRRDGERPQRWEYRRVLGCALGAAEPVEVSGQGAGAERGELAGAGRSQLAEELAADGWEACGTWLVHAWFKRPAGSGESPGSAGEHPDSVTATPPPGTSGRAVLPAPRFPRRLALTLVASAAVATGIALVAGAPAWILGFAAGLLTGAAVPLVLMARVLGYGKRDARTQGKGTA